MRKVDISRLSQDECWSIQINGTQFCKNCKWTGISACAGQNIRKTGYNSLGYHIGEYGLIDEKELEVHSEKR